MKMGSIVTISVRNLIAIFALVSVLSAATIEDVVALGRKALQNGGTATAWKIAQTLLLEMADSALSHEFAGEVLFRRGEFSSAEDEFKRALKLQPEFGRAWWGLARISECSSMHETADRYFRRAHDQDPADLSIFRDWALHLTGPQHIEALEKYLTKLDPSHDQDEIEGTQQHLDLDRAIKGRTATVLASPFQSTQMPLLDLTNAGTKTRTFGLAVKVKGENLRLMLDTGATGILIQQRAAERSDVEKIASASFAGIGDNVRRAKGYRGIAKQVVIGSVEFRDVVVGVSEKDIFGYADGLIGTDVFSQFLVEVDFPARMLRLTPLPEYHPNSPLRDRPAPPAGFTPVFRFGHMLLIPARVNESPERLFLIDSGAARTMVSYDLASEMGHVKRDDALRMGGMNGTVADAYETGTVLLQFAGFRQKNLGMTAFDMREQSRHLGTELSGFLGLPLLNLFSLTIDYRAGFVKFDFPNR
jgi:hypothetical protein